jgi:hypothetical protein
VGRLAAQENRRAVDWSELAGQTIDWGQKIRSGGESVPAGPVRDALAAVDEGSSLDGHAADWRQLHDQLEQLLSPPKNKQEQNQPQQNQDNQQQKQSEQSHPQSSQSKDSGSQGQEEKTKQQNSQQAQQNGAQGRQQPQQEQAMQQVGGAQDQADQGSATADPKLAPLLQKLEQLKGQDSASELLEKIGNNQPRPPPDPNMKDW